MASYAVRVPSKGIVLRTHSRSVADRRARDYTGAKVIRDPRTLAR